MYNLKKKNSKNSGFTIQVHFVIFLNHNVDSVEMFDSVIFVL